MQVWTESLSRFTFAMQTTGGLYRWELLKEVAAFVE
jgi:hypothetical protein